MNENGNDQSHSRSKLFVVALLLIFGLSLNVFQKWKSLFALPREISYPAYWNNVQRMWIPSISEKNNLNEYIEQRFKERKRRLDKICSKKNLIPNVLFEPQLIFAPKHHVAVCFVQKAGSTTWNRLVWGLRHNLSVVDPKSALKAGYRRNNLDVVRSFTTEQKKDTITSSFSVMIVRHPFARLISGWSNKFHRKFIETHNNHFIEALPEVSQFLMTPLESRDYLMTFKQFLNYLVHLSKGKTFSEWLGKVDAHFRPASSLCSPCLFDYKYIVKAESSPNDLWWVLDKINTTITAFISQSDITPVAWQPTSGNTLEQYIRRSKQDKIKLQDNIKSYFNNVHVSVIDQLFKLYNCDFENFGYTFNTSTLMAGGLYV